MRDFLSKLKAPEAYRKGGREHIFPSDQAFVWFVRSNRDELIAAQALLKLRGRTLVHEENFDAYVMAAALAGVRTQSEPQAAPLRGEPAALLDGGQAALLTTMREKVATPASATSDSPQERVTP